MAGFSYKGVWMKASQISTALTSLIKIGQPVFIWGPPGIGKSQVVKQTTMSLGIDLIDIRAILLDPVDLRGLPKIGENNVSTWCPPAFLPQSGEGVLFLDELNAAPPLVQAACYQLVLDRRLGEYQLPPGWSVVSAGNREQDRAIVHRMPSALANRFVHLDFTVDTEDWVSWALRSSIVSQVVSFIRFRPGLLNAFNPDADDKAFPSPRSWEFVSRLIQSGPEPAILNELIAGAVGNGAAAEFMGFLKIWEKLPQPGQILSDPLSIEVPKDPAILFALCELMGHHSQGKNAGSVLAFAARLPAEFSVLLVREAVRRNNEITQSQAFSQWAQAHADVLV